mgnify:CR=1 FL=1
MFCRALQWLGREPLPESLPANRLLPIAVMRGREGIRARAWLQASFRGFPAPGLVATALEQLAQESAGVASRLGHDFLRRAAGNQLSAAIPALGSKVEHPVRRLDDLQIVLDDDDRVPLIHQLMQDFEQLGDVVKMQAARRPGRSPGARAPWPA